MGITAAIALLALGAASPRAPSLDDLLARNLEARGGSARLAALHTLHLSGKVTNGTDDGTIEMSWTRVVKRPGAIRTEASVQGLTAISAWDGAEGWRVSPFEGRREAQRYSADEAKRLARDADLDGPLVGWREKRLALEYLGTEDVDGTLAHKIRVTRPGGDVEYVFLDPDHFLAIRVELHTRVRGVEVIEQRDLGEYAQVGGVWIPFSVETGPKGGPRTERIAIARAAADERVDDALFRVPPAGSRPGAALAALPPAAAAPAPARQAIGVARPHFDAGVLSGLGARNIGSAAMSGRISAIAAHAEGGKTTVFVGAASGGVWRSTDGGTTFRPVFDRMPVQSIGAITIDPGDPRIVWVGTGESWTRNSVSIGDGIYRSVDGGETWANVGLRQSERIIRILVHPRHSEVVYACVPGKLWSDSSDRGVYRTTDGGKTWALVLRGPNPSTGCGSLTMDSRNPDHLLAGLWDFRRKGWTFRSGGDGPEAPSGSSLFTTSDGGRTWTELTGRTSPGLPPKPWGRVEVELAPSDPRVVYAFVESTASSLFRSGDGGRTWEARDRSQGMVWRPFYFARLIVDPANPDRLFKPGYGLVASVDGGKSFAPSGGGAHGDWHDVWIDPANTQHVIGGDDGGLWISWDGGSRWWKGDNLPISQFYHVSVDAKDPYQVYGGLQDNGTWAADSSFPGGIDNSRWELLDGGDGFWAFPDPTDPDAVYAEAQGGYIVRMDRRTRAMRDIQPKAGYHEKLRFNWNTPIHLSPTDRGTIYLGAQFLFRSRDRGDTWERISPDLTTNDPRKQRQEESGGVTVDNSSAEMHTTIYAIAESPRSDRVIWVGTDDGNLQLTRDGGATWANVAPNVKGLPPSSWVSSIEASHFDEATAYATFDRHTFGDMDAWVYRTRDFGKTWSRIAGPGQGLRGYAHVVKEDVVGPDLLFVGTELGLWVSVDGGRGWAEFKGGDFPAVAVRDLAVHPRDGDLVIATHGRGIWIVDDLTPLRALSEEILSRNVTFLPSRPVQERMPGIGSWVQGDAKFEGASAPAGAVFSYYQATRHLFGPLKLEILDAAGRVLDTVPASARRGLNRASWSMRVKPPRTPPAAQLAYNATQGPRVVPGEYQVRLTKGGEVFVAKLDIGLDRRAPYTVADRKAQFDAAMRVHALFGRMSTVVDRIETIANGSEARGAALAKGEPLRARLSALAAAVQELRRKIVATREGGAITGEERLREHADLLYGAILTWEGRPTSYQLDRIQVLERELADVEHALDALVAREVPPLDRDLAARKLPPIPTVAPPPPATEASSADLAAGFGRFLHPGTAGAGPARTGGTERD